MKRTMRDTNAEAQPRPAVKTKNITVDSDLVEALNAVADRLAGGFGFRPTLSQTLRYLIKRADQ